MKNNIYGWMGFLSLLGLLGLYTKDLSLCAFFGFAVNFQYFFIPADEMLVEYMNKSAARAFFCGMFVTAAAIGFQVLRQVAVNQAFVSGVALGWGLSIAIYAFSSAYYAFKETIGVRP